MKKIIVLLLILASPLFAEKGSRNFKKVFTQEEKQIFLDSMNKYRSMIGVKPVQYLKDVERLANVRIETIYNHLKDISDTISEKELRKNCLYHLEYRNDKIKYVSLAKDEIFGHKKKQLKQQQQQYLIFANSITRKLFYLINCRFPLFVFVLLK